VRQIRFALLTGFIGGLLAILAVTMIPPSTVTAPATHADTLSIPNEFFPQTVISSADFNANFTAIEDIVNGTLNDSNLKNDGITGSTKLIDSTVSLAKMAPNSVNSIKILNQSILSEDILDNTIREQKLLIATASSPSVDGYSLVWDEAADMLDFAVRPNCSNVYTASYEPTDVSEIEWLSLMTDGPLGSRQCALESSGCDDVQLPDTYDFFNLNVRVETTPPAASNVEVWVVVYGDGEADWFESFLTCEILPTETKCSTTSETFTADVFDRLQFKIDLHYASGSPGRIWLSFCGSPP